MRKTDTTYRPVAFVTKGQRHRRRSALIIGRRAARHTTQLLSFSQIMVRIVAICVALAIVLILISR